MINTTSAHASAIPFTKAQTADAVSKIFAIGLAFLDCRVAQGVTVEQARSEWESLKAIDTKAEAATCDAQAKRPLSETGCRAEQVDDLLAAMNRAVRPRPKRITAAGLTRLHPDIAPNRRRAILIIAREPERSEWARRLAERSAVH